MRRKGFTLIELMIVIAIIIILAAIAVPVYANIMVRAKRARVLEDFRTLQSSLEAYKTDWGVYPITGSTGEVFGHNEDATNPTSVIARELTGINAALNTASHINALNEKGGIDYFTRIWIICKMQNPFDPTKDYEYYSSDGSFYELACEYNHNGTVHYILKGDSFNYKDTTVKPSWYVDQ